MFHVFIPLVFALVFCRLLNVFGSVLSYFCHAMFYVSRLDLLYLLNLLAAYRSSSDGEVKLFEPLNLSTKLYQKKSSLLEAF